VSKERWTPQQQEAIAARGGNLLVAAAAGAGKTSVLVERIISYLKDRDNPIDVDRLLVVTFTNAAAAQMREKIGRELTRELNARPTDRQLRRQLTLLNHASIATLHSFCLEVLRQHFYRLDLDPGFRVADDGEAGLLQLEVLEDLLEAKYQDDNNETNNEAFLTLVDCYGGERDDAGLIELILNLYRFARSTPWPKQWLQQAADQLAMAEQGTLDDFAWCAKLKQNIALHLTGCRQSLAQAIDLCARPQAPLAYLDNLYADLDLVQGLLTACSGTWEKLSQRFQGVQFGRLKPIRKKDAIDPVIQEQVKNLRDKVKNQIVSLQKTYFTQSPAEQLNDLQQVAPLMRTLVQLVLEFGENFRQAKNKRGIVDFNDLEHYCLQILLQEGASPGELKPSPVAEELQARFVEILVDEYQDINAVQEAILQLVSRQRSPQPNLFMVGDVKQSIYRFRLADPGLFLTKYQQFSVEQGQRERRINLRENFRSSQAIVDGVNFFFRQIMTPEVGELAYDQAAELVCGLAVPPVPAGGTSLSPVVDVFLIEREDDNLANVPEIKEVGKSLEALKPGEFGEDKGSKGFGKSRESREFRELGEIERTTSLGMNTENEFDELAEENEGVAEETAAQTQLEAEEQLETADLEARVIARQISRLVEQGDLIWDPKAEEHRPVTFRDVAILMRATRGVANVYLEEFRRQGIPLYAELGTGYFAAGEVETILSLLQIIDNPRQDIPLVAVLRSPLVGLNADELAQIRASHREGGFYEATVAAAANLSGATAEKLQAFLARLEEWRTIARRERLTTLLWEIVHKTDYYDYVAGMPGGAQRQANLRLLQTWAGKYEATTFRGLFHFLRFVERLREKGEDLGSARTLSENEDVVRIMSIHKSKGLEFPVVFVAGLGRQFNLNDLKGVLLTHKQLGIGPQLVDYKRLIKYPTLAKLALAQQIRLETLAEEMRLLYVAMTRARDKLCLVGTGSRLTRKIKAWCQTAQIAGPTLPDPELAQARCYLDWLGPALARHPQGQPLWATTGCPGADGKTDGNQASRNPNGYLTPEPSDGDISQNDCLGADQNTSGNQTLLTNTSPTAAQFSLRLLGRAEAIHGPAIQDKEDVDLLKLVRQGQPLPASEMAAEIDRRLAWQYPWQTAVGKRAKLSVTEIKSFIGAGPEETVGELSEESFEVFLPSSLADQAKPAGDSSKAFSATETSLADQAKPAGDSGIALPATKTALAEHQANQAGEPSLFQSGQTNLVISADDNPVWLGVPFQPRRTSFTDQPRFVQQARGLTAAERGSAMHLVLQHLDLRGSLDRKGIKRQVMVLQEKEILTPEQAEAVDTYAIARFWASNLGQRILQARQVLRELPFSLAVAADQLYPELPAGSEERVIIQGVIDCLAEEEDGFLLVDYKTDWLGFGQSDKLYELVRRYQGQMSLYTQAVESIFRRPVKEKYLYFLSIGAARRIN
jgi:ATP-dependent helicase/nuclease subunit A